MITIERKRPKRWEARLDAMPEMVGTGQTRARAAEALQAEIERQVGELLTTALGPKLELLSGGKRRRKLHQLRVLGHYLRGVWFVWLRNRLKRIPHP